MPNPMHDPEKCGGSIVIKKGKFLRRDKINNYLNNEFYFEKIQWSEKQFHMMSF